ncbi:methyltransferase family protein [Desulfocapsa sulfexigens DSM 10523]|uniref:Methyltransferase family protein n=1 Tax=Desulfocapsa sulfexigens (strain DSM 10523 / SB164P1) TaxID=1167006 RepID=M1P690_DESSD|nr:class I SAM-dependent methyltransferase [Desulfocapsa sulfexigens]AGF78963.1 methyltransferase family protein [Desulfocapsa sulfexigens DSM 10523]
MKCKICNSGNSTVLYHGKIRIGRFGELSTQDHTVFKCLSCKAGFLPNVGFDYEDSEYRVSVEGSAELDAFQLLHDVEQTEKLVVVGSGNLRGRIIADIGCGGGSFLDLVGGMASETIAIEPCLSFQKELAKKHKVYSYVADALSDWTEKVDFAVSFAVLEHVDDPLLFLKQIRELIKPGGRVLISTPNYDDWLLQFHPGIYDSFFYRQAHRWYFNGEALQSIAVLAGYKSVELIYKNRFDLSNALHWLRDNRPTGKGKTQLFTPLDCEYKKNLEQSGKADFIYAWLYL